MSSLDLDHFRALLAHLAHCSISIPLENIKNPKVFRRFQGGIEIEH